MIIEDYSTFRLLAARPEEHGHNRTHRHQNGGTNRKWRNPSCRHHSLWRVICLLCQCLNLRDHPIKNNLMEDEQHRPITPTSEPARRKICRLLKLSCAIGL